MWCDISENDDGIGLFLVKDRLKRKILSLFAFWETNPWEIRVESSNDPFSKSDNRKTDLRITRVEKGWKITCPESDHWVRWQCEFSPSAIIFPTREGEFISDPGKLPADKCYSLSYPGTASSRCAVIFIDDKSGFLVGSSPSLDWARLSLRRNEETECILEFLQKEQNLFLIPFENDWREAVDQFSALAIPWHDRETIHRILNQPRFLLQMGVIDYLGKTTVKRFSDLVPLVRLFRDSLGDNNFVHLFGTNEAGFDRSFPDFSVSPGLGGEKELSLLVDKIHGLGLYASHHFNPRLADEDWFIKHPEHRGGIVKNEKGEPTIEFYKKRPYLLMNPNYESWRDYCLKTIGYFQQIGFDYIEIDQIAYQRNIYTPEMGFGHGYQKLIEAMTNKDIKFWVEGVSDIYQLPADCHFQILQRGRAELWETDECRRGYPFGDSFPAFWHQLMPAAAVSYQLVTENGDLDLVAERFEAAKEIGARIYDLELGYVDNNYQAKLRRVLERIKTLSSF